MKALSVRSPWWFYLIHGFKPVENRTWPSSYRGPLLIHASRTFLDAEVFQHRFEAQQMAARAGLHVRLPDRAELLAGCGKIVGQVEMVDCVRRHDSPFFCGPYGHVYRNAVAFKNPLPVLGKQGFFDVPDSLIAEARVNVDGGSGDLFSEVRR